MPLFVCSVIKWDLAFRFLPHNEVILQKKIYNNYGTIKYLMCGYSKYLTFFFFLLSRCNFKINIFSFYHFPTDYIKSSMRLKDFGSKQCTHTVSPGDPSFLFRWQWWRFSCKQLKITDAVCEHAAPQNLSTGRTLACNKEQKKKSCWLYFPLFSVVSCDSPYKKKSRWVAESCNKRRKQQQKKACALTAMIEHCCPGNTWYLSPDHDGWMMWEESDDGEKDVKQIR